jgi:drug/metabolite transporter (DMT)-like permease
MHPEARGHPSSPFGGGGYEYGRKSSEEKKGLSLARIREGLKFVALVLVYYFSNSFVILTNKQLIGKMDFHFPIMLTALHMITTCCFSFLVLDVLQLFKKQNLTKTRQKQNIMFLALIFCVSIVCGNWSLRFIHVSFMEMVGATTPFFVSILGFLIFNMVHHWRVYASLVPIVGGIMMSTYFEGDLSIVGFVIILTATFFRGLRTVFQGHLLAGQDKLTSPNLLRYMSMYAFVMLSVTSLMMESSSLLDWLRSEGSETYKFWHFALLLTVNPIGAYVANLSQFLLIQTSSALTFQVIGNTKGAVTIVASVMIFRNQISFQSAVGYIVTLSGVAWYTREKTVKR